METKLVEELVNSFVSGDNAAVSKLLEKEIRKARAAGRIVVAKRLNNLLKSIPGNNSLSGQSAGTRKVDLIQDSLLFEKIYSATSIEEVVLNSSARNSISNFLTEWESFDALAAEDIFPINKLIFYGLPGTGKTKLAYGIANKLDLPLVVVRLDELISSYLGKTGKNIREIFDIARQERCVIFLDEIDTVAKHRDDSQELGELKRVVTVLLQNIDSFPSSSILIGATNHAELLDKALWRRFGLKLEIELPSQETRALMFELFLEDTKKPKNVDYGLLSKITEGMSGSLINDIALSVKRGAIIERRDSIDTGDVLRHMLLFRNSFSGLEKLNKRNVYTISQQLKNAGYSLKDIAEISGVPYTTLRDNVK